MKNSEIIKKSKSLLKSNYGKVIFPYFLVLVIFKIEVRKGITDYLFNYMLRHLSNKQVRYKLFEGFKIIPGIIIQSIITLVCLAIPK